MENASKALIIAGAILLVIAIIAIAVGIVSKTRGTMNIAENQIDTMAVQMHNKQFEHYEGIVTGRDVKECIATALANNNSTKNREMFVRILARYKNETGSWKFLRYGKYYSISDNEVKIPSTYKQEFSADEAELINNSDIYKGTLLTNAYGIIYGLNFVKQ